MQMPRQSTAWSSHITHTPIGRANNSEKSRGTGYTDLASIQSHIPLHLKKTTQISQPSLAKMQIPP